MGVGSGEEGRNGNDGCGAERHDAENGGFARKAGSVDKAEVVNDGSVQRM